MQTLVAALDASITPQVAHQHNDQEIKKAVMSQ